MTKPKTWDEWDALVDYMRTANMHGDFARGQRRPERHRPDGRVDIYLGTFARGMRGLPPVRCV